MAVGFKILAGPEIVRGQYMVDGVHNYRIQYTNTLTGAIVYNANGAWNLCVCTKWNHAEYLSDGGAGFCERNYSAYSSLDNAGRGTPWNHEGEIHGENWNVTTFDQELAHDIPRQLHGSQLVFTPLGKGSCCHSAEGCKTTQMAQEVLHGTRLFCQVRHRTLVSAALGWGRRGPHGLLHHARGSRAQTRCAEKSSCSGFDTDGQTCRLRFGAPVTATSEPPVRLAGPRCQYYRCYSAWSQTVLAPAGAGVTRSNKLL